MHGDKYINHRAVTPITGTPNFEEISKNRLWEIIEAANGSEQIMEISAPSAFSTYEIPYDIPKFRICSEYNVSSAFRCYYLAKTGLSQKWQQICT
jgi:hypothetical protein